MTFTEALEYLMQGKCVGIKPSTNSNFIVRYKPKWMNAESPDYMLCWNRSEHKDGRADCSIRTNQYLEEWYPVIIDHRELSEDVLNLLY